VKAYFLIFFVTKNFPGKKKGIFVVFNFLEKNAKRNMNMVPLNNNFFMGMIFNGFIKGYRYVFNGKLIHSNHIEESRSTYSLNLHANP